MRIRLDLKIFVFAILFYLTKQIELYAILMIFALFHELGHIIFGLILGFKVEKINIMPMGLSISFKIPINNYNKKIQNSNLLSIKKIIIAMAGPIVNLILALIFIFNDFNFNEYLRENIIYANFLVCIFNLLPIYPLDGGRIIKQVLKIKYGIVFSVKLMNIIENISIIVLTIIASIAIYYFENIAILFIIIYLWILVINENRRYNLNKRIYEYAKENRNIMSKKVK